jgi:excisionase family DNA binding protein
MNREIKFEGLSRELAPAEPPLSLADIIERFGRALTATQLALILSISKIAIYKYAKAGRLPSFRIGTSVRFCPKAVADWLRRQ